jgi:oligo-1,6-glucosidase
MKQQMPASTSNEKKWWKEAVVYQIYPRSFKDSDGDGIGDLQGIISRLDYIQSLGIDVVWLNPVYASPNDDNGYDISNYQDIMKEFGTMQDFDELLKGLHERGIKLIMDLVVNHSSDEHAWFRESRKSKDNPFRDYYHWWPAEKGNPSYRWSVLDIKNEAWAYDADANGWYLHYFSRKQPDLKWENPQLRKDIYAMMHYWFKKGIDGFRMDVISAISKDTSFPVITQETLDKEYGGTWPGYYAKGPRLHEYLQEMNQEVLSKYDSMTVAEGWGVTTDDALEFVDAGRKELNMLYHFEGMDIRHLPVKDTVPDPQYDLIAFKNVYTKWDKLFAEKGWGTIYLGNHDQSRMVSRWGNDDPEFREFSSKMLTTFLLTMRGTAYYFAGDELGMTSIKFDSIEEYQDLYTINNYKRIKAEGGDEIAYLEDQKIYSRDNGRTPFQWDNTANAGFTKGSPWLKINPNYTDINVQAAEKNPESTLHYFRKLLQLRKENKTLVYGKYSLVDKDNPKIYAYTRESEGEKLLVVLNFSAADAQTNLGMDTSDKKNLLSNYKDMPARKAGMDVITLRPYEAIIFAE